MFRRVSPLEPADPDLAHAVIHLILPKPGPEVAPPLYSSLDEPVMTRRAMPTQGDDVLLDVIPTLTARNQVMRGRRTRMARSHAGQAAFRVAHDLGLDC